MPRTCQQTSGQGGHCLAHQAMASQPLSYPALRLILLEPGHMAL